MLNWEILRYSPSVQRLEDFQGSHVPSMHTFKIEGKKSVDVNKKKQIKNFLSPTVEVLRSVFFYVAYHNH